jgi:hypothetical protein
MRADRHSLRRVMAGVALLSMFLTTARAQVAPAKEAPKETGFLRFVEDPDGGGKLETSLARYTNDKGVTVDLVSAVHVGERTYYRALDKRFSTYDSLLYEMVKPKGMGAPVAGQRSDSMVSMFQMMLKDVLELEFQLDGVDYQAKNFVHADLDAEEFMRLQSERGENLFTLMLRAMLDEMAKPQAAPDITLAEIVVAFTSPDRARHLKMMLGRQFEDMEKKVAGFEGPNGSVIVGERNKKALEVLKQQIAKGDKKIGVFYGAAHMPDLEKQLLAMGFKRTSTEWLTAWDMTPQDGDIVIKRVRKPATNTAPQPVN